MPSLTSPAPRQVRTSNPVLAVSPFANMSSNAENEYLADGVILARPVPDMEVIERNSTVKHKDKTLILGTLAATWEPAVGGGA